MVTENDRKEAGSLRLRKYIPVTVEEKLTFTLFRASIADISATGARLITSEYLSRGTRWILTMKEMPHLTLKVEVRWVNGPEPAPRCDATISSRDAISRPRAGRSEAHPQLPRLRKATDREALRASAAYDYELPADLVARTPAERRDAARLLVLEAGGVDRDRTFADFPALLRRGDVLVLNETRVIPARLRITRAGGGGGELLLLRPADRDGFAFDAREWFALVRPGRRLGPGTRVDAAGSGATILGAEPDGVRRIRFDDGVDVAALVGRHGELPLPPYVGPGDTQRAARYQTVFARVPGSVAAPTASLHFTPEILTAVASAGVEVVRLTLDVGIGTFRPMRAGPIDAHRMHGERFAIPAEAAAAVMGAKRDGRRVVAAGTTVVRALEGAAEADGVVRPGARETRLFITPGFEFRVVDALLTNFHLPRSTLLVLVAAFVGYERTRSAYEAAIGRRYRFFSFGDAMFAERAGR